MDIPIAWRITLNISNLVGLMYNIPQMYHTWKTKSTSDISTSSQVLRTVCSIVWVAYAIDSAQPEVGISWGVSLLSSIWTLGFKARYEYMRDGVRLKEGSKTEDICLSEVI